MTIRLEMLGPLWSMVCCHSPEETNQVAPYSGASSLMRKHGMFGLLTVKVADAGPNKARLHPPAVMLSEVDDWQVQSICNLGFRVEVNPWTHKSHVSQAFE